MDDPKDHPFRVIDGGIDRQEHKASRTEVVRTLIEHEGVRIVMRGRTEVWELTDPGAWTGTPLGDCPPFVAYVLLGLSGRAGLFEPGEAADCIKGALELHEALTPRRERVLAGIPRSSAGFGADLPRSASLEFWWQRWWAGIAG